jgi:hypothetical protein
LSIPEHCCGACRRAVVRRRGRGPARRRSAIEKGERLASEGFNTPASSASTRPWQHGAVEDEGPWSRGERRPVGLIGAGTFHQAGRGPRAPSSDAGPRSRTLRQRFGPGHRAVAAVRARRRVSTRLGPPAVPSRSSRTYEGQDFREQAWMASAREALPVRAWSRGRSLLRLTTMPGHRRSSVAESHRGSWSLTEYLSARLQLPQRASPIHNR